MSEDEVPEQAENNIPSWLIWFSVFMVVFGLIWFYLNLDGPPTWLDPDHWVPLEKAANTTFSS